ncbi:MAG: 50S ribosomal protein L15 [Ignavibacteriae bacterium]|nr:50S ribosomal protein L15 [Ignavibacteriota bacterium]
MTKGLNNLQYAEGSRKRVKRIGRGQGSGHGGTATKGNKGAHSRSGAKFRNWFEGGQMPLNRRIPKVGFFSPFRVEYQAVNVARLEELASKGKLTAEKIDPAFLFSIGAISSRTQPVKILGEGEIKTKLNIVAHAFSETAKQKIESAGGSAQTVATSSR